MDTQLVVSFAEQPRVEFLLAHVNISSDVQSES